MHFLHLFLALLGPPEEHRGGTASILGTSTSIPVGVSSHTKPLFDPPFPPQRRRNGARASVPISPQSLTSSPFASWPRRGGGPRIRPLTLDHASHSDTPRVQRSAGRGVWTKLRCRSFPSPRLRFLPARVCWTPICVTPGGENKKVPLGTLVVEPNLPSMGSLFPRSLGSSTRRDD